jgi:hypothetical protein
MRYELILSDSGRDEYVMVESDVRVTPSFGGQQLHDGALITIKGRSWVAHYDTDTNLEDGVMRFVCTPADGEDAIASA